jgi:hypothetical protein
MLSRAETLEEEWHCGRRNFEEKEGSMDWFGMYEQDLMKVEENILKWNHNNLQKVRKWNKVVRKILSSSWSRIDFELHLNQKLSFSNR